LFWRFVVALNTIYLVAGLIKTGTCQACSRISSASFRF